MAKIKLYIAKAQSNNSGAAKGTAKNPYTVAEFQAMLDNGTWLGGYVQNLGYCMKEVVISSSYLDSGVIDSDDSWTSDDSWPSDDLWSSDDSVPWDGTDGLGNNHNGGNQGESNNSGSYGAGGSGSISTGYSVSKAVSYLKSHSQPYYIKGVCGKCARAVREALEAGGLSTAGHPESACDYDTFLPKIGFHQVDKENYIPQKGDIIVLEAVEKHRNGHIAMFSGDKWISDFVQRDMWGGEAYRNKAEYTLFRR